LQELQEEDAAEDNDEIRVGANEVERKHMAVHTDERIVGADESESVSETPEDGGPRERRYNVRNRRKEKKDGPTTNEEDAMIETRMDSWLQKSTQQMVQT
jgi:hypothetical protein